jgi:regulator of replication initiation timing
MRLDQDKLEALRRWGHALRQAPSEEYAAAGRAILVLIEENERLRLELERGREPLSRAEPVPNDLAAAEDREEPVGETLHGRLQRALGRSTDSSPETQARPVDALAAIETGQTVPSPQSWIETLRRQK